MLRDSFKRRLKNLNNRIAPLVAARNSLDQLDDILRGTVAGKFPDIGTVADTTHRLRSEVDQILIGLVESCCAPANAETY